MIKSRWVFILLFSPILAIAGLINVEGTNPVKNFGTVNLTGSNVLILYGPVDFDNMEALAIQVREQSEAGVQHLTMIIDSPGGYVSAGEDLIDAMEGAQDALGVTFSCFIKRAYSMAAIISAYCDNIYIHKRGTLMHHEIAFGVEGSLSEVLTRTDFVRRQFIEMSTDVASHYGMTFSEFWTFIGRERWFTSSEAVAHGLADAQFESIIYDEPEMSLRDSILDFIRKVME